MKYKYLVANPFGVFLVRCETMKDVKEFVRSHYNRCKKSYELHTGKELKENNYQIRDLTDTPIYS